MFKLSIMRGPTLIFLISALIIFYLTCPFTVQSGDTGELVTNSYFLRVSHPPGYPLWALLYHLPVRYLNFGNPFQTASAVTILISLIWMGLLASRFNKKEEILVISVLASSLLVWRYALLPDVFALHILFLTLVFLVFERPELLEKKYMIFLISLSVAHHHTIVFAFPLFLYAILQNPTQKKFFFSLFCGAFSLSIYFVLLLFHPEDYGSWNFVTDFNALAEHFLRKEYGTFSLAAKTSDESRWISFYILRFLQDSWSILLILIYLLINRGRSLFLHWKRFSFLISSIIAYFLVFSIMGEVELSRDSESIYERFLIHPTFLFFFFVLMILKLEKIQLPKWIGWILLINVGVNISKNFSANNYKKNTYIEDYLLNILNMLPQNSVYFTDGDTNGFGTYYLKDVMKIRPDLIHIHSTWGNDWFQKNLEKIIQIFFKMMHLHFLTILISIIKDCFQIFLPTPSLMDMQSHILVLFLKLQRLKTLKMCDS